MASEGTMQTDFEAWMATSNYPEIAHVALAKLPDGNYKSQLTFAGWQGWQGAYNTYVRELVTAANRVLVNLEQRIDAAPRDAVPVFDGIVELRAALTKATA